MHSKRQSSIVISLSQVKFLLRNVFLSRPLSPALQPTLSVISGLGRRRAGFTDRDIGANTDANTHIQTNTKTDRDIGANTDANLDIQTNTKTDINTYKERQGHRCKCKHNLNPCTNFHNPKEIVQSTMN